MCGVAGLFSPGTPRPGPDLEAIARRVTRTLQHRGPDAEGTWSDARAGIALGHRRLSILDLSPAGAQPMHSACGRYVIVFNGEIYNHMALRAELPAQTWRGHSDTETLLAAIAQWGLEKALQRSAGMFALALWDTETRTLSLARDRLGEKPLFFGRLGADLVFASELKALRCHPDFRSGVDPSALAQLLARGCIGAPSTIYPGIFQLPPGTTMSFREGDMQGRQAHPVPYWTLDTAIDQRLSSATPTPAAAVDRLESLLCEVVAEQMVADVPVGAFLSGGIDSSLVVAMMQQVATTRVRTFTIGFPSRAHDESTYARRVAQHLRTDHTELRLTDTEVQDLLPRVVDWFDQPFGDSSALPTYLVSNLARKHVTVCLSGDGGDEMFAGYTRYGRLVCHWNRVSRWPLALRRAASSLCSLEPLPMQVRRALHLAGSASPAEFYARMVTQWPAFTGVVRNAAVTDSGLVVPNAMGQSPIEGAMYADTLAYLPNDVLTKVDRTAMANSLEVRIPLLDCRVVEWAWTLPLSVRRRDGIPKWPLRTLLARHLPTELIDRPKMGFGVPLDDWLRGPLREWAEDLLSEARLQREGHLDPRPVRAAWRRHLTGEAHLRDQLWPVLMFEQWLEAERRSGRPSP